MFAAHLLWALCGANICLAAMWAEGPYLGTPAANFRRPREVADAFEAADFVFVGIAKRLETSKHNNITGDGDYTGDIAPEKFFKGVLSLPIVSLSWHPYTTGISDNSKHIFFVKRRGSAFDVLKTIFVHDRYPWCRTYGAMDGGTAVTMDALTFFASPDRGLPVGHGERLMSDLKDESVHRQATAVLLAYETLQRECLDALLFAVANKKEDYLTAAFAACLIDGELGARAAIALLETNPTGRAVSQRAVFDIIATAKNTASLNLLRELGDQRPEYRVSCAFAIRAISSTALPACVEKWRADHKHDDRTEALVSKWERRSLPIELLLAAALQGKNPEVDGLLR